jgi:hypothetical protein
MPPEAYALVTLFLVCSLLAGIVAVQVAARLAAGPTRRLAYVLPIGSAFAALYLVGHRLGLSVGPEVALFGFQVALLGDVLIGFAASIVVALGQALVARGWGHGRDRGRSAGARVS